MKALESVFCALLFLAFPVWAQENPAPWSRWAESNPTWVAPTEPFKIIGNVYYVGTEGLSSFLIPSEKGHVLLDGGLPQNAPTIAENIAKLGFSIDDVKVLLNSHAHVDHSGGLASLKKMSGATMIASEGDRSALEGGYALGDRDDESLSAPPVVVDRAIEDGEKITLGQNVLTARLTPGHTRGCTSWVLPVIESGVSYEVLFFCSATVAGNRLVPPQYDGIVEDFRETFRKTRNWSPDVFLANHPSFFKMKSKRKKLIAGDPEAFVDREGFGKMMQRLEESFERQLREAEANASPSASLPGEAEGRARSGEPTR